MKIEFFEKLKNAEDCLQALEGNYYDTHDLNSIEEDKEELEILISANKYKLPKGVYWFFDCKLKDGVLINKYS